MEKQVHYRASSAEMHWIGLHFNRFCSRFFPMALSLGMAFTRVTVAGCIG